MGNIMKQVKFTPGGGPLTVSFNFGGLIIASYTYTLWPAHGSMPVDLQDGDNEKQSTFVYSLPGQASDNAGRVIELRTEFTGLNPNAAPSYSITAIVLQDGVKLDPHGEDADKVTGKIQHSTIYVELIST
jgi:hypothetical protein